MPAIEATNLTLPTDAVGSLGPYPVLQMIVGAVVVVAGLWMMVRANRDKEAAVPPAATVAAETQIFMQGPLVALLSCVRELVETAKRNEGLLRSNGELQRDILEELRWMNRVLAQDMPERRAGAAERRRSHSD